MNSLLVTTECTPPPLEERVYQHVYGQLSARQVELGTHLKAGALAESLGVSRTTVRKALSRLVTDGWLQLNEAGCPVVSQWPDESCEPVEDSFDLSTQTEAIYWRIFDWILDSGCQPGGDVKPQEFANRLGVSVGTVRQVFDWLTRDGLLERAPRRGWQFISLTWQDAVDTVEIRTLLETEVIRRANGRIPAVVLEQLRDESDAMLRSLGTTSERDRRQADYAFHQTLADHSGCPVLVGMLMPLIRRSMYGGITYPGAERHMYRTFSEHRTIAEALLHGDLEAAVECLQIHLSRCLQDNLRPRDPGMRLANLPELTSPGRPTTARPKPTTTNEPASSQ